MKRAGMRLAAAAGVVVLGLYAIALAQRGSVTPSQAAPPTESARPRFVRPDTVVSDNTPATATPQPQPLKKPFAAETGKNSLSMREPNALPSNPAAKPLAPQAAQLPPSNARYVTQQDANDYRDRQRYANDYDEFRRDNNTARRVGFEGEAGGVVQPSVLPIAGDQGVALVDDSNQPQPQPTLAPRPGVAAPQPLNSPYANQPVGNAPPVGFPSAGVANPAGAPSPSSLPPTAPPTPAFPPQGNLNSNQPATIASGSAGTGKPGAKTLEGPQSPSLIVEKFTPPELQIGRAATFTVTVRNVGTAVAHDVEVHDEVPAGTQLINTTPRANRGSRGELVWTIGALKPNDETSVTIELLPTTEGEIGSVATVRMASNASGRSTCTRPELMIDLVAPREVLIGEDVALDIKVSNPGTGVASNVVLSEVVPPGLEHVAGGELEYEIGDLRPNETRQLQLTLKAAKAGAVVNRIVARGEGPLEATREATITVIAPALDVALEGPRRRFLDRQAVYTLALSNPGTAAAKEISLVAQLPLGLEFVEANNAGQYDARTRTVHWLLEELPPRETGKVTVTTLPTEAGDLPLKIVSNAQRGLTVEKQETIRVEGIAALVFQVLDQADPIDVNGETIYEVRVTNQGSKAAENVQVVATLPQEMKAVAADGPARHEIIGQQVSFQPLARLAPKSETIYTIRVQATRPGDVKISVQLKSADLSTPVVKEEATRVLSDQ